MVESGHSTITEASTISLRVSACVFVFMYILRIYVSLFTYIPLHNCLAIVFCFILFYFISLYFIFIYHINALYYAFI